MYNIMYIIRIDTPNRHLQPALARVLSQRGLKPDVRRIGARRLMSSRPSVLYIYIDIYFYA